jgi:hypothetical protein
MISLVIPPSANLEGQEIQAVKCDHKFCNDILFSQFSCHQACWTWSDLLLLHTGNKIV